MKAIIVFLGLLLCNEHVSAQSVEKVRTGIINYLDRIDKWDTTSTLNDFRDDSLEAANKHLLQYLKKVCVNNMPVLRANFKLPKNSNLSITTSEDGNLRIYSWDTKKGGTMVAYNSIAQYSDGVSTNVKILNNVSVRDKEHGRFDYGSYYDTVYAIKTKNDKIIYLVISGATLGIPEVPKTIRAYTLESGELMDTAKVFVTPKKTYNRIDIDYDIASAVDRNVIHLSPDKEKLYIPIIGSDLKYTGKYFVYVFDGYNFVFDKNAK